MRGLRTIPVLLDVCRDMEEVCPGRAAASSTSTRWRCCAGRSPRPARSAPWDCATRCSTPPPSSRTRSVSMPPRVDYLVAGINHLAFFLSLERRGRGSLPAPARAGRGRPRACRRPSPVRGPAPPRLLRDRVLRALRRVRAVVHQVGPARPDRRGSRSRSTSIRGAASARSRSGRRSAPSLQNGGVVEGRAEQRIRRRHHQRLRDRASRSRSTATCRTRSPAGS